MRIPSKTYEDAPKFKPLPFYEFMSEILPSRKLGRYDIFQVCMMSDDYFGGRLSEVPVLICCTVFEVCINIFD